MTVEPGVAPDPFEAAVAHWLRRWRLQPDGAPREAFGVCLRPVLAPDAAGPARPAMLKIVAAGSDERRAGELLRWWQGHGAVEVFAAEDDALLMARVEPGTSLSARALQDDDDATRILASMMRALHARDAIGAWPGAPLPTVERWGEGFGRHLAGSGHPLLPAARVAAAGERYRRLCASQGERHVLHGDFHHDNLLFDAHLGWRVIDPKGVVGEQAFEAGSMLRNPFGHAGFHATPQRIARRVDLLCRHLPCDPARLLDWCEVQAVLAAVWFAEDAFGGEDTVAAEIRDALRVADAARALA